MTSRFQRFTTLVPALGLAGVVGTANINCGTVSNASPDSDAPLIDAPATDGPVTPTLAQRAYLKASNSEAGDSFGTTVALSGDGSTLAVAATLEDSNATMIDGDQANSDAQAAGAVYVFVRVGDSWEQQAYLKPSNTGAGDELGHRLALSADGSFLAVNSRRDDSDGIGVDAGTGDAPAGMDSGAVFVFARSGTAWSQQAYLKAASVDAGLQFGNALSMSNDGDRLAVGVARDRSIDSNNPDDRTAQRIGAAYVFRRSNSSWVQEAYLKASNPAGNDQFGNSLAISGDGLTLAVGAPFEDSNATGVNNDQSNDLAMGSGAVYVFTRSGTTWSRQAYIKASNTGSDDQFGFSVALSDDGSTMAVGAPLEDGASPNVGGDQSDNSALDAGAVYVYTRANTTWSFEAYIKASNPGANDQFGSQVMLSADGATLLARSIEDTASSGVNPVPDEGADGAGAVYLYTRTQSTWAHSAFVKASNPDAGDAFGDIALSADGLTFVVGARNEDSNARGINGDQANNTALDSGAAYVFERR